VDLATGNVNIDNIQFRNKDGKIPFSSHIAATSGMAVINAGTNWQPMLVGYGNGTGWTLQTPAGGVNFSVSVAPPGVQTCTVGTTKYYRENVRTPAFTDATGASHGFNSSPWQIGNGPAGSGCTNASGTLGPYAAIDGSGYSLVITNGNPTVYSKSGNYWPGTCTWSNQCALSNTFADPDGATIAVNYSNGTYTEADSLNTTVFTSMPNPYNIVSPFPLSYLDASGRTQSFTFNGTALNIATNFHCLNTNGVQQPSDYSYTGFPIFTSITTPTGDQYVFTYESTPGKSGYYTG
jgi:hypothetical protein